jgi:hypothetical protein
MCRTARLAVLALSFAGTLNPSVVRAQARASLQQRQEQVLKLHVAHALSARDRLKAYEDSVRRVNDRLDSLQVGPLRLLVQPPFRARTEIAAQVAAARIDSMAGSAVAKLASTRIVVKSLRGHLDSVEVSLAGGGDFWSGQLVSDSALARWIGDRAIGQLYLSLGTAFHEWLGQSTVFRPNAIRAETWTELRLQLISSPSFVSHLCYDGDVRSCSSALGFARVSDPITQWYDADGRRRLVVGARNLYSSRVPGSLLQCEAGDDARCTEYLRLRGFRDAPINPIGRFTLTQLALDVGGRQAYERLLNSTGAPGARLAEAAGVPLDSLLSVWSTRVRTTAARAVNVTPVVAAGSLAWILLCAGLSLRSSRWR